MCELIFSEVFIFQVCSRFLWILLNTDQGRGAYWKKAALVVMFYTIIWRKTQSFHSTGSWLYVWNKWLHMYFSVNNLQVGCMVLDIIQCQKLARATGHLARNLSKNAPKSHVPGAKIAPKFSKQLYVFIFLTVLQSDIKV